MAGDKSLGSGHNHDEVQGVEVLRTSLLTQEMTLKALENSVDRRFWMLEGHFDDIIDRLDALAMSANRIRNDDRQRLRDDFARGQPVNKHVPAHHRRQHVYSDDSEENEDFLFGNN